MDFEKELPKMCVKDDAHMGKHFAVGFVATIGMEYIG